MSAPSVFAEREGVVRYLHAFRVHWLKIAVLVAVTIFAAALYSLTATKRYEARADLQIQPFPAYSNDPFQGFGLFRQSADGSSPVVVAARVMSARDVKDATYRSLGDVGRGVSLTASPLSQADIVTVAATGPDANQAAQAANGYADTIVKSRTDLFQRQLKQRIEQIQAQINAIPAAQRTSNAQYSTLQGQLGTLKTYVGSADPTVQVLTPAAPPGAASWPRPLLSIVVAGVIGLLLGCGLAVALELVNPRVGREDELTLLHRLPILARVPRLRGQMAHDYLAGRALLPGDAWKGYRTLRAVLATAGPDGHYPKSILVTSASPGDGKTMTAVNLAITLAAADLRVTLVDGDFHRPMIATIFNTAVPRDGLTRLLLGKAQADKVTVPAPTHARLKLLLSNREQTYYLHRLDTDRFRAVIEQLEETSDVVVIDSPPLPEVAEVLAMAEAVDTVVIAIRLGHTLREKLAELRELLTRRGIAPLGFVVTTRERAHGPDSPYDYSGVIPVTLSGGRLAETLAAQRPQGTRAVEK